MKSIPTLSHQIKNRLLSIFKCIILLYLSIEYLEAICAGIFIIVLLIKCIKLRDDELQEIIG